MRKKQKNSSLFSDSEQKVLKILGRKKMLIGDLVTEFYRRKPVDANNKIGTFIRRIQKKCDFHELPWTLDGQGAGRNGRTIWRKSI
jgi:hypothetical protein